ncbi:MAG: hypothetical protein ABSF29_11565 [Tepidisphaeraceae bacterium]|jgi:hypothetical protein
MTVEQLKKAMQSRPFRPFVMYTADGAEFPVPHPELLWHTPAGRTVIVSSGGDNFSILDLLLVTELKFGRNGTSRRRRRKRS